MAEIHNIFSSNSVKKESEGVRKKIIVDFREKSSRLPALLFKCGFDVDFRELKVGDYIVGDVVIERKEVRDFVGSIINRRLVKQLLELAQIENKFLFVEGELDLFGEKFFGISSNAVRGFLLSVGLKYKVPIIFTGGCEDSAKFMWILVNKKNKEIDLNFKKRARTKREQMEFILEGFGGVGPKNARKLLEEFGSLKNIFDSSFLELEKVIGKKAEVFRVLDWKY